MLIIAATFALGVCAMAQQKPSNDPRSAPPGTNPSTMPSQAPDSASPSSPAAQNSEAKGEKKLKGCIKADGSAFVLEEKKGKHVSLTGQDLAAHVGHTVVVHGTYAAASSPGSTTSAGAGDQFTVNSVDMVSSSCSGDKDKSDKTSTEHPQ
jgi:hypothetical protein